MTATLARRPAGRAGSVPWFGVVALVAAGVVGMAVPKLPMAMVVLALGAGVVVTAVALHPPMAAYVLLGVTPLIAGIDRGQFIPLLRPNEALAVLVAGGLAVGGILRLRTGRLPRLTVTPVDRAIVVMAVFASVVPLLWLMIRRHPVEHDDLLYALMIWKYYGVYLIVRLSIRTEQQVERCLWIAMAVACVVSVIAMMEALRVHAVIRELEAYYAPYGNTGALNNDRGGSTLALPVAVADLMVFNLAIAVGLLLRGHHRRPLLIAATVFFVTGALASGQFSGAIALALAAIAIAAVTGRLAPIAGVVPVAAGAGLVLRPVIEKRLSGFHSLNGIPVSWSGRLHNLHTYFWPQLFHGTNVLLGVRPAARVVSTRLANGYVWIESGYTWLLWAGGIPLLLAFLYFLGHNLASSARLTRTRPDAVGAAALGVFVALVVVGVLMAIDPHITYRGSADLLFALLAMASPRIPIRTARTQDLSTRE